MHVNTELKKLSRNFVVNTNIIRKENGLSYRGLARAAGISDSTVRYIDSVRRTRASAYVPSLGTVVKMAQACGVQAADILAEY
jgi:transcriptional regulator with XRE-family HTH domain